MYHKVTLDNGLRIITSPMPHTRSVSVCIYLGVGSRYETAAEAGISHFIEHLMFRGTDKRPHSKDISGAIEGVGGILNGATDKEMTVYWCKVAQPHFEIALDVLVDMVLHSRLDVNDIEKERRIIIEEIGMYLDTPQQLVGMLLDEILWPDHPLGRDGAGTKESVTAITREQMLDYISGEYSPANMVVSIAGNIQHEATIERVNKLLGHWPVKKPPRPFVPYIEKANPRLIIERKETEQTQLCLALPAVSLIDPRRYPLDLMNVILGEAMSSRLFLEVRDKLGLVYDIHSYLDHFQDTGALTVYAGVDPKNVETGIKAILHQLTLLKEPVGQEELNRAKEFTKGRLLLRMEDSRSVAGWLGGAEVLSSRVMTVEEVVEKIDAITAAEMAAVARELLVSEKLRLSLVGPVKNEDKLLDILKI
ncbi:MAG: pitrilysin family protein [Dehalococcoidales bacterium]|nr:pitrilysin family protein [Dehalococcoidales bacterium]